MRFSSKSILVYWILMVFFSHEFPLFSVLESIIRFSEIKYSVREPQVKGEVAIVKIPILRIGDTSKVSVVRVHTKDGSATSGEDYNPMSEGKSLVWWLQGYTEAHPRPPVTIQCWRFFLHFCSLLTHAASLFLRCRVQGGREGALCGDRDPI